MMYEMLYDIFGVDVVALCHDVGKGFGFGSLRKQSHSHVGTGLSGI